LAQISGTEYILKLGRGQTHGDWPSASANASRPVRQPLVICTVDVEKLRKKGRVKKFGIESAAVSSSRSKPFIAKSQPQYTFLSWFC
jgi:hypothetical protein